MFLAGGVGKDSPHCIITLVGSDPTVRPLALNRKQALAMVDQRAHDVLHEKVNCDAIGTPCDQRVHFQIMPHVHATLPPEVMLSALCIRTCRLKYPAFPTV